MNSNKKISLLEMLNDPDFNKAYVFTKLLYIYLAEMLLEKEEGYGYISNGKMYWIISLDVLENTLGCTHETMCQSLRYWEKKGKVSMLHGFSRPHDFVTDEKLVFVSIKSFDGQ